MPLNTRMGSVCSMWSLPLETTMQSTIGTRTQLHIRHVCLAPVTCPSLTLLLLCYTLVTRHCCHSCHSGYSCYSALLLSLVSYGTLGIMLIHRVPAPDMLSLAAAAAFAVLLTGPPAQFSSTSSACQQERQSASTSHVLPKLACLPAYSDPESVHAPDSWGAVVLTLFSSKTQAPAAQQCPDNSTTRIWRMNRLGSEYAGKPLVLCCWP